MKKILIISGCVVAAVFLGITLRHMFGFCGTWAYKKLSGVNQVFKKKLEDLNEK